MFRGPQELERPLPSGPLADLGARRAEILTQTMMEMETRQPEMTLVDGTPESPVAPGTTDLHRLPGAALEAVEAAAEMTTAVVTETTEPMVVSVAEGTDVVEGT